MSTSYVYGYCHFGQKIILVCDDCYKILLKLVCQTNTSDTLYPWYFAQYLIILVNHKMNDITKKNYVHLK